MKISNDLKSMSDIVYNRAKSIQFDKLTIESLIECAFFASLRRDESRNVICTIVLADPNNPDPDPPKYIRPERWIACHFSSAIPLTSGSLARYAQAIPYQVAQLAVWPMADGTLAIWGFFDQANAFREFRGRSRPGFFSPPGLFQIEVTGPGEIDIYDGIIHLASLRLDILVSKYTDVILEGPINQKLSLYTERFIEKVQAAVYNWCSDGDVQRIISNHADWYLEERRSELSAEWRKALSRILIEIKAGGHGGALILNPKPTRDHLRIGAEMSYSRVEELAVMAAAADIVSQSMLNSQHNDTNPLQIQFKAAETLYRSRSLTLQSFSAMVGAARMVGSFSGLDGAVLLEDGLNLVGANVVIAIDADPEFAVEAIDSHASSTRNLVVGELGTRHRSMIRFCSQTPDAIGFVISQDGAARAITSIGGQVTFWKEIKLEASYPPEIH